MSKATEDVLAALHGAMAEAMAKKLKDGTATASDLSVIRQFLKDNGINSDPTSDPKTKRLSDMLPTDLDDLEGDSPTYGSC